MPYQIPQILLEYLIGHPVKIDKILRILGGWQGKVKPPHMICLFESKVTAWGANSTRCYCTYMKSGSCDLLKKLKKEKLGNCYWCNVSDSMQWERNGIEQFIPRVFHIKPISGLKCSTYIVNHLSTRLWVFCQKELIFGQAGNVLVRTGSFISKDYICISLWNLPKEERSSSQQVGGEDARVLNLTSLHRVSLHKSNSASFDCTDADITRSLRTCLHIWALPPNFYFLLSPTFTQQL